MCCYCVCVCLEYWWTWGAILYPYADIACLEPTRNYTHHTKQYKLWSCCCCCRAYYLYRLPFSIMIWPEAMRNILYTHIHRGEGQHIKQLGCLFLLQQQAIYLYIRAIDFVSIYFSSIFLFCFCLFHCDVVPTTDLSL